MARWIKCISLLAAMVIALACTHAWSQQNPQRLIMKDGTYQAATKWEVVGQRVRYYSAERYDWEEVPNDMVDWPATDKYNGERAGQRDETIKEIAKADEADEHEAPLLSRDCGCRIPAAFFCRTNSTSSRNLWSWSRMAANSTSTRAGIFCVRR